MPLASFLDLVEEVMAFPFIITVPVNPNFLAFTATDSLGGRTRVVYRNTKPAELEHSERVVLKGKMQGDNFECSEILLKCPSKYKDDKAQLEKVVVENQ
jgi:cytochrome c-type biogenesis protein CcmE